MKLLREVSKLNFYSNAESIDHVNAGSLQRIADAALLNEQERIDIEKNKQIHNNG